MASDWDDDEELDYLDDYLGCDETEEGEHYVRCERCGVEITPCDCWMDHDHHEGLCASCERKVEG